MNLNDIKEILNRTPELKTKIFARGFLLTDADIDENSYPFYGLWNNNPVQDFTLMVSPEQTCYVEMLDGETLAMVGHAYNPYTMESDEKSILKNLLRKQNEKEFFEYFNELTGIFTCFVFKRDGGLEILGDPTCMQTTFYCRHNGHIYVSSHTNMLGALLNLEWDPYIKKLTQYKLFKLFGKTLPGDLTQFSEVKRLVPNYVYEMSEEGCKTRRFYWPHTVTLTCSEIEQQVAQVLSNNMKLIVKKWDKPSISLTGGCDSKTTLACAKDCYNQFSYFSYISSEAESVDADAAHSICDALGLQHEIHHISDTDGDYSHIEEIRAILYWNAGSLLPINKNDVRKRAFYYETNKVSVEIKSWVSEIGRAYYSKRFNGRTNFGETPTPRKCTTLYKVFLNDRKLVKDTDRVFADYLSNYFERASQNPVPWQEQFFWEFRVSSWNSLIITGEHKFSFDIVVPYNNRKLLELLLSAPMEARINDSIYTSVRKRMNPSIDNTGIAVTNLKHTKNREKMENIYYMLHTHVPF